MSTTYQFTRQSLAKKPTRHIDMGISGELPAQTIEDTEVPAGEIVKRCVATAEMTVGQLVIQSGDKFWLVAVAAVSPYFPNRFFVVVCRHGEYVCSRELPKVARIAIDLVEAHRQARREAQREASVIAEAVEVAEAADSQVAAEITSEVIETESLRIPAGTKIFRIAGSLVFYDTFFVSWVCSCGEMSGRTGGCEHIQAARSAADSQPIDFNFQYDLPAPVLETMAFAELCRGDLKRAKAYEQQAASVRRGYATRTVGVRRDEAGRILR